MVGHGIVDDTELARIPPVSALVRVHELGQVFDHLLRDRTVVSEAHRFAVHIPFVNPTCVGRNHLIEEGLASIGRHSDSRKHLGYHFTVARLVVPLPLKLLLLHLGLGVLSCLDVEHRLPAPALSRGWIVLLGHCPNVPHAQFLKLVSFLGILVQQPLVHLVGPDEWSRASLSRIDTTKEADVTRRVRRLSQLVVEWNRLTRRRLIGSEHLRIVENTFSADYELPHSSSSDVVHFLEARLVQHRCPFLPASNIESLEHHRAVFAGSVYDKLVLLAEVFLKLHETDLLVSRLKDKWEHGSKHFSLLWNRAKSNETILFKLVD